MFAIVRLGNTQFKVKAGDFLRAPFIKDAKDQLELPVLAIGEGTNFLFEDEELKTSKIKVQVLRHGLSKKVLVFKKKRRKGYRRTNGHRQKFTEIKVLEIISGSSRSVAPVRVAKVSTSENKNSNKTNVQKNTSSTPTAIKKAN